jgi:hypothetical protein
MNARGRPHRWQRRMVRELYFGGRCDFTTSDFFAIVV